jgi:hypothetical protein
MKHKEKKENQKVNHGFFIIGLLSILWFIARTGRKPSRVSYPCQQAAQTNANLWIITYILPTFSRFSHIRQSIEQRKQYTILAVIAVTLAIGGVYWRYNIPGLETVDSSILENGLNLTKITAVNTPSSDIFVVTKTTGEDGGIETLIRLMGSKGLKLYQAEKNSETSGPSGVISASDTVIIKVNCQWNERGGTNTDLLKALIQSLLNHPEGFTGEIIVCDNGGGEDRGSLNLGGSFIYDRNNAVDTGQSVQDVVDEFSGDRVSTYLWSDITDTRVYEFSEGDMSDGYIVEEEILPRTGLMVSYPKFTTKYSTCVSFKHGVWDKNSEEYDSETLKVINLSMLKSHLVYGVTACVKNYMGVPSDVLTSEITGRRLHTHSTIGRGGMGALMVNTRYPVLNIIDSIWINPVPLSGPSTPYNSATQINVITASTDPVALDYWSVKYILSQNWLNRAGEVSASLDPDNTEPEFFGNWLKLSREEILLSGIHVNMDESYMNVFITENN